MPEIACVVSFKTSETLLGIETRILDSESKNLDLQNLWNPFRDWNSEVLKNRFHKRILSASKPLKPF